MFILAAGQSAPGWTGEIGREAFETLEDAEAQMRHWARFGVDAYCNEPDVLWITDQQDRILKVWDWSAQAPVNYTEPDERQEGPA